MGLTLEFEENGTSIKGHPFASGNAIDYLVEKKDFLVFRSQYAISFGLSL